MQRQSLILLVAALLAVPRVARAQDADDSVAYHALTQTPLGALAPVFDLAITGERSRTVSVRAQYGLMSYDTRQYIHNFGVGIDIPVGTTSVGVTGGYYWPNCKYGGCPGHAMFSANVSENLVALPIGRAGSRGAFNIGFDAAVGAAMPKDSTLVSGKVAIPFSLIPSQRDLRIVPYIEPGLGVGLIRADSSQAGLLFTLGAGVGLIASRDCMIDAGIQRIFMPGGNWVVGAGVTIGGRH